MTAAVAELATTVDMLKRHERTALGYMLVMQGKPAQLSNIQPADFLDEEHAKLCRVIDDILAVGKQPTIEVVENESRRRKIAYSSGTFVLDLMRELGASRETVTSADIKEIAELIIERAEKRRFDTEIELQRVRLRQGASLEEVAKATAAIAERAGARALPLVRTICLASVEPRSNKWLWFGRLASGEMVVITGAPGVGKGLLLCYIVSRFSTGRPMFGDRNAQPAGNVLWISVEDALDTSLAQRLIAAGADRSRIHAWDMDHGASLPEDTDLIVAEIDHHNCGMLIIDPAPTLLGRDHSSNNDADVRRAFSPLAAACRARGCALILVRHTNKRQVGDAQSRGGGSIGWTGMARVELMLGRRVSDPESTTGDADASVVTLATVKNNLGKWAPSLNLRIVEAGESARVEVIGETDSTADDLCAQDKPRTARKTGEAEDLIRSVLGDGQWHRQKEVEKAADDAQVSRATLRRAKESLGVRWDKRGPVYWWSLPAMLIKLPGSEQHAQHEQHATREQPLFNNNNYLEKEDGQVAHVAQSPQVAQPDDGNQGEDAI